MVIVFCGHSNYIQNTNDETNILHVLEVEAGNTPCEIFLGGYGRFDDFALLCAKKFKQRHPNAKLILITPYLKNAKMNLEKATFDDINNELLEKFIPMLNHNSKEAIFQKILDGEMDWHFIKALLPYADYITTQIEAAVVAGALPWEVLDILNDYYWDTNGYRQKQSKS